MSGLNFAEKYIVPFKSVTLKAGCACLLIFAVVACGGCEPGAPGGTSQQNGAGIESNASENGALTAQTSQDGEINSDVSGELTDPDAATPEADDATPELTEVVEEPEYIDPEVQAALQAKHEEQQRIQAEAIAERKAAWQAEQEAAAEARRAQEQAAIEARLAAETANDPNAHEEGERAIVSLIGVGNIIATWTMTDSNYWGAWFYTDNYSRIYAFNDAELGWRFESAEGRQVIYSDVSSEEYGLTGPGGLPSNWRDAQDPGIWY